MSNITLAIGAPAQVNIPRGQSATFPVTIYGKPAGYTANWNNATPTPSPFTGGPACEDFLCGSTTASEGNFTENITIHAPSQAYETQYWNVGFYGSKFNPSTQDNDFWWGTACILLQSVPLPGEGL